MYIRELLSAKDPSAVVILKEVGTRRGKALNVQRVKGI